MDSGPIEPIQTLEPLQPPRRNPIFFNYRGIRSGWRLLVWFGLSLGGLIAALIVLVIIYMLSSGMKGLTGATPPVWLLLVSSGLFFVPIFLAAVVVALTMEHRPVGSLGLGFHSRWLRELAQGCALGAALLSSVMLILVCLGAYRIQGFNEGFMPALGWGLAMAAGFVGVGLFEEFLFRGYALQNLMDGIGRPAAVVISCLLFAAVHCSNPGENPAGILEVLLGGILLLVLILRTRSLWMAVGLHAAWDWTQNFLFGVADSGMVLPGGLLRSTAHGPTWLSGGAAGPEGSVIALLINGLAILYVLRAPWIRPAPDARALWARYIEHQVEIL